MSDVCLKKQTFQSKLAILVTDDSAMYQSDFKIEGKVFLTEKCGTLDFQKKGINQEGTKDLQRSNRTNSNEVKKIKKTGEITVIESNKNENVCL